MPLSKKSTIFQTGLSTKEVETQTSAWGQNSIPHKKPPSDLSFFLAQLKNPLVFVLLAAMVITLLLQEYKDGIIIGLAILINTILGFVQERKAFKTLESLKSMLTAKTWVLREGDEQHICVEEVVPADILVLKQGEKVSADGLVIEADDCWVNEAIITGESSPVEKQPFSFKDTETSLVEMAAKYFEVKNHESAKMYMGTIVTGGSVKILVTATGKNTMLGQIATDVQQQGHEETPLEKRLEQLAKRLTQLVIILAGVIFILGILRGREWVEMFTLTVALAVAAIPEGLVVSLTAVLALGMYRILQKKAVVKRLMAAETLGSVDTVCLDKTGTLTEGKLQVVETAFTDEKQAAIASVLANDKRDPLDFARLEWAESLFTSAKTKYPDPQELEKKFKDREMIPFSSEKRIVASLAGKSLYVLGAPEDILSLTGLGETAKKEHLQQVSDWAEKSWRVIAFATKHYSTASQATDALKRLKKNNGVRLQFLGLMAFSDPVRKGIRQAIEQSQKAGIHPMVITGDYAPTAKAVMKEIGLSVTAKEVITGEELEKLSDSELNSRLKTVRLFARTKPAQKLRIVQQLKQHHKVVAMMGDGVNDAPALSAADIGIVVEDATEVAQEASDLVLLNQNYKTILAAIEEGRLIFQNLRKITLYLLSDTFTEIILVVGSLIMGWPLPITAAQILWVNLVNDGLPNLALTLDPKTDDLLKEKPLERKAPIVDLEIKLLIGIVSLITGGGLLLLFGWLLPQMDEVTARTIVFTTLSIDSLLYVFSCRNLRHSILSEPPWKNKWLFGSVILGFIFTFVALYVPFFANLLEVVPLELWAWEIVIALSAAAIIGIEATKLIWLKLHPVR